MIDDPEQVKNLMEKMKANLPIQVQGTKELIRSLKLSKQIILIGSVLYMGDEGGIACALKIQGQESIASIVSLTHLRIADAHPLAKDIRSYQTIRTKKLQNG